MLRVLAHRRFVAVAPPFDATLRSRTLHNHPYRHHQLCRRSRSSFAKPRADRAKWERGVVDASFNHIIRICRSEAAGAAGKRRFSASASPARWKIWHNKWFRYGLRFTRIGALCTAIWGGGYVYGCMEVVEDPEAYDSKMFGSVITSSGAENFVVVGANDTLQGGASKSSGGGRGGGGASFWGGTEQVVYRPHVYNVAGKINREEGKPKTVRVPETHPVWQGAIKSQRVFCRIKDGALTVVERTLRELKKRRGAAETDQEELEKEIANWKGARRMLKNPDWKLVVMEDKMPNAFVHGLLPRRVFVHTGLFEHFCPGGDEELAVVLGHELSHAILKHSQSKAVEDAMLKGATLMFIFSLDPTGLFSFVVEWAMSNWFGSLVGNHFSRQHECEADALGTRIAAAACYDPVASMSFFERMHGFERSMGATETPTILRTHPPSQDRLEAMKSNTTALVQEYRQSRCTGVKGNLKQAIEYVIGGGSDRSKET